MKAAVGSKSEKVSIPSFATTFGAIVVPFAEAKEYSYIVGGRILKWPRHEGRYWGGGGGWGG